MSILASVLANSTSCFLVKRFLIPLKTSRRSSFGEMASVESRGPTWRKVAIVPANIAARITGSAASTP